MFAEIYYSSSLGVTFPAMTRNFYLSPFNSRQLIGLALAIDDEYRHQSKAVDDMLLRLSPELAAVPIDYEVSPDLELHNDSKVMKSWSAKRLAEAKSRAENIWKVIPLPRTPKSRPTGKTASLPERGLDAKSETQIYKTMKRN